MNACGQSYQDLAAAELFKMPGRYLEIGSGSPVRESNTYLLDVNFGWSGVCIDVDHWDYSCRSCQYVREDAVQWMPQHICGESFDYISFDIDDATTLAVQAALDNNVSFRFATVEHDKYRCGYQHQNSQHQMLSAAGYVPMFIDIPTKWDDKMFFEDWWCHPDVCNRTLGVGITPVEALEKIKSLDRC